MKTASFDLNQVWLTTNLFQVALLSFLDRTATINNNRSPGYEAGVI